MKRKNLRPHKPPNGDYPYICPKQNRYMKRLGSIWISLCLLLAAIPGAQAGHAARPGDPPSRTADSIMEKVIFFAPLYERIVEDYKAELYIKGKLNIRKRNHIMRFIPSMFRMRKGVNEYMMETYNDLHFSAPDQYDQKVKASAGTASEFWEADGRLPEYFHVNVYSPTLLYDKLISPLAPDAKRYYNFRVDSVWGTVHARQYKIRFTPRSKSFQLVEGYMVVSENVWSVREMRFTGRSELFKFDNLAKLGEVGEKDEFLPLHYDLQVDFRFLGNVIEGDYTAVLNYTDIKQRDDLSIQERKKQKVEYDLSDNYTLRCDTNACRNDVAYFDSLRPLPLSANEQQLYTDFFLWRDTSAVKKQRRKGRVFWGQVGDWLTSRYTVNLSRLGSVRCSPLINPFLVSYSGKDGISYSQEFKYSYLFNNDRLLHMAPEIGYNFKNKEFYWRINTDFYYWPQKRTALHVEIGNGNRIYSSEVLDDLKAMPDSLFDFDQIHLDYFKDLYFRLRHTWEIVNGLTLDVGLSIHRRTEGERSNFVPVNPVAPPVTVGGKFPADNPYFPGTDTEILGRFRHEYNSFAPRISLSWAPGQYYYMDGKRKINLHSRYPRISVEWERGIKGVLRNSGSYERVEVDLQHGIALSPMRDIYFRLGWGKFTNRNELYFVDFTNFTRRNLPIGWNDEIGGVFQLLDGRWYNSSREYLRGHVTYEAPFLLMRHLMKYTQYVLNERLYFNALAVPHLKPYIEVGYGIGTHVFDFGVFASFANWQYQEIGCKFTFELFNR